MATKATADIAQFTTLFEINNEIDSLKKAKTGIKAPTADPRSLYPYLTLKTRMTLLSKILAQKNLVDYQ